MGKRFLRVSKMSHAVEIAQGWMQFMISHETRGPGDTMNAMRRLSARHGIPYAVLWNLKYRPPKDLFVETFTKLEAAHEKELGRAAQALDYERSKTAPKTIIGRHFVSTVAALDGEEI